MYFNCPLSGMDNSGWRVLTELPIQSLNIKLKNFYLHRSCHNVFLFNRVKSLCHKMEDCIVFNVTTDIEKSANWDLFTCMAPISKILFLKHIYTFCSL